MVKPASATATAAPVSVRNTAGGGVAKLGDRFIAFVLDAMLLFGAFAVVDGWIFMRWGTVDGMELNVPTGALLLAVVLNALILFVYGWLLDQHGG